MSAIQIPAEPVGIAFGREVNTHTLIGLGMIACALFVVWLIRRSRA
jgi:predicted branched-subunit amino acid permease